MPFYDYECENCKIIFEIEQKITDERLVECSNCNQSTLKRLISTTNFELKGGGWYSDLYSSTKKE